MWFIRWSATWFPDISLPDFVRSKSSPSSGVNDEAPLTDIVAEPCLRDDRRERVSADPRVSGKGDMLDEGDWDTGAVTADNRPVKRGSRIFKVVELGVDVGGRLVAAGAGAMATGLEDPDGTQSLVLSICQALRRPRPRLPGFSGCEGIVYQPCLEKTREKKTYAGVGRSKHALR